MAERDGLADVGLAREQFDRETVGDLELGDGFFGRQRLERRSLEEQEKKGDHALVYA
jgi:hypothetical protein